MAILISDKVNFRIKNITSEKEGQFTMIKDHSLKKHNSSTCVYTYSQSFIYTKQTLKELRKDFTPHSYEFFQN